MYKIKDIDHFRSNFKNFGFTESQRIRYPKQVERAVGNEHILRVCIAEPCINIWDGKDKNNVGEFWLETISGKQKGYGTCRDEIVKPYITDLIEIGIVDQN